MEGRHRTGSDAKASVVLRSESDSTMTSSSTTTSVDQSVQTQLNAASTDVPLHNQSARGLIPTHFVPMGVSFSEALRQTKIICGADFEMNLVVYRNIKIQYLRSLNPRRRWLGQSRNVEVMHRWICKLKCGQAFSKWCVVLEDKVWNWACPIFQKVSFWDLKGIHEAKVLVAVVLV
jgi:hypothetical protein